MTRSSTLVFSIATLTAVIVGSWIHAQEKTEKGGKEAKSDAESVDTFLKSLEGNDTPESDRCPGETPADRAPEAESEVSNPPAETESKSPPVELEADPIPDIKVRPGDAAVELTPQLQELKEKVRDTLAWYYDHPQKVTDRSPWGIMHWLIPFGVDSYVLDANGKRQNTVGYLCYNYPCKGQRLFHLDRNKQLAAQIGPGLQGHRGQFLAMLAQSKVDPSYPMRVEGRELKVADLIEYEKRTCEAGTELTFKLIALAHYLKHDEKWKNSKGEDWDLPRLIREELKQSVVGSACGGTHRMTGFSYAVHKHEHKKLPIDGQWLRASKFINSYHDYTATLQNRDGSFSTNWFASKGELPDPQRRLQTSGHTLEWLVYSLPAEDLRNKRLIHGVEYLTDLLAEGKKTRWEIGPLGHALHALALYDERVFGGKPGKRGIELSNRPQSSTK